MQLSEIDSHCAQAFLDAPSLLSVDEATQLQLNNTFTDSKGTALYYDIFSDSVKVGDIGFYKRIGYTASMSYALDQESDQGKGIVTKSGTQLRDVGFDLLGLRFINLFIAKSNIRSQAVASRLGAHVYVATPDSRFETWTIEKGSVS